MTMQQFYKLLAQKGGFSQKAARAFIKAFAQTISELLEKGDNLVIRGLGKYYVSQRGERTWKNPKTGETKKIPQRKYPRFRFSSKLIHKLNK